MSCKLVAKEEVEDDLSKLSHAQRVLVFKQ
jgi:hypothetical protein